MGTSRLQADVLHTGSETLNTVAKALKATAESLYAIAFFPAIYQMARYVEGISKATQNLANVMEHLSNALKQAIKDHQNGDVDIKGYFSMSMG